MSTVAKTHSVGFYPYANSKTNKILPAPKRCPKLQFLRSSLNIIFFLISS